MCRCQGTGPSACFTEEQRERIDGSKEVRDAVYRQLPISLRNLLKNQREHDDEDFEDTWCSICKALAKNAHTAENAAPIVEAFNAPYPHFTTPFSRADRPYERPAKRPKPAPLSLTATDPGPAPSPAHETTESAAREEAKTLICEGCQKPFPFTKGEAEFYTKRGFTEPERCKECRKQHKAQRGNGKNDTANA